MAQDSRLLLFSPNHLKCKNDSQLTGYIKLVGWLDLSRGPWFNLRLLHSPNCSLISRREVEF